MKYDNTPKKKKQELMVFSQMGGKFVPHGSAPLFDEAQQAINFARENIKNGTKWKVRSCYGRERYEVQEWFVVLAKRKK